MPRKSIVRKPAQTKTVVTTTNRKPRRKAQRKRAILPQTMGRQSLYLSPCAKDYMVALANARLGPLACVPDWYPNSTRTDRVWCKGIVSTGPASTGWVFFDPICAAMNDRHCVVATQNTYANAAGQYTGNVVADTVLFSSNSQYNSGDIGPQGLQAQYRVVSAQARIHYSGTKLNEGGYFIALVDPTHGCLNGRSIGQVELELQHRRIPIKDKWVKLRYFPYNVTDFTLSSNNVVPQQGTFNAADPNFYMGFQISSPVPDQRYEFEFYVQIEFQGRDVRGQQVRHTDPTILPIAVQVAMSEPPNSLSDEEDATNYIEKVLGTFPEQVSRVNQEYGVLRTAADNAVHAAAQTANMVGLGRTLWNSYKHVRGPVHFQNNNLVTFDE